MFSIKQQHCPFCKNFGETFDHIRCFGTNTFANRTSKEALMWYQLIHDNNAKDI